MKKILALVTLCATAVGLAAQDTTAPQRPAKHLTNTPPRQLPQDTTAPQRPATPQGVGVGLFRDREKVNLPATPEADEVRALIQSFRDQREAYLRERQALLERLRNSARQDREALITEWRTFNRDNLDAQRELAREIREQLRQLRQRPPGG
jgi:hypothetical protein